MINVTQYNIVTTVKSFYCSKNRFVSSIAFEDVRSTRRCGHVVNLANRETAVLSSVLLQWL